MTWHVDIAADHAVGLAGTDRLGSAVDDRPTPHPSVVAVLPHDRG